MNPNSPFDLLRGYAGAAPGQDLTALLQCLTIGDLQLIIGVRVLPLLPQQGANEKGILLLAAENAFRNNPTAIFADPEKRQTLLRNLVAAKRDELRHRLNEAGYPVEPSGTDIPALADAQLQTVACKFLGIPTEEVAEGVVRPPSQKTLEAAYALFPHQRSVVRRAYARVGSGRGRTIIHMPTGAGKTRTAVHLMARALNESEPGLIVWLAVSRELLEQAAETFELAWSNLGNRPVTIDRFWGDGAAAPSAASDGVVIAGLAKLHAWRQREPTAFLRLAMRTRLVIMDEAHQAIAPTYRALIDGLAGSDGAGAVLGLTATPGRTWNDVTADEELSAFFNRSKVILEVGDDPNPVKHLISNGYLARPSFSSIAYTPTAMPSEAQMLRLARLDDYSDEILDHFAADTRRNLAIIEAVKQLIARGHTRIILFAASVGHAQDIASALAAHGVRSAVVSGETPLAKRAAAIRNFKSGAPDPQVLCNFGVLTTGFDAPKTSAAVIARPTKSLVLYSQMVGRATRGTRAGGNATCDIMTVHDPNYPGFGSIAEAFFNWEDVWNHA